MGRLLNRVHCFMDHDQFLFVNVYSPTWLLYVTLLLLAVFFRFSRLFSVRNLDVVTLLSIAIALVVSRATRPSAEEDPVYASESVHYWSSIVVLALSVMLVIRLTFDESLTRRPRLEQNLNQSALKFLLIPAFSILMMGVFLKQPIPQTIESVEAGAALLERQDLVREEGEPDHTPHPTEMLLAAGATKMAELSGRVDRSQVKPDDQMTPMEIQIVRTLVVIAHSLVVLGLIYIGRKHFSSNQLGWAMSCLYLLLPCTAYQVNELSHVIPGACLTWAFAMYRRPVVAGILLGLACGSIFFAAFLLPLWAVFYSRKHRIRFMCSLAAVACVVLVAFALTSENTDSFVNKLVETANWTVYRLFNAAEPLPDAPIGHVVLRITLAALFMVMFVALTFLPRKRNLENLLANSTALIVMAQLWYPEDVGSYVLWYLPLLLLVVFRPRLDRFVPPEDQQVSVKRRTDDRSQSHGTMPRVTLYN